MYNKDLVEEIKKLKELKNAVILAHNYQRPEIQDIADYTGDSLDLSRKASNTDKDIIVFSAVRFMAETAAILNPDKKVLLPDQHAGCGLAEMCKVEALLKEMDKYPDASVVSYVNTFADVKAVSDICCTSSNAVDVVKSLSNKQILFVPDRNLATYVNKRNPGKMIIPYPGYCYVHQEIDPDKILELKQRYPDALTMVHPECPPIVRELADFIGSTAQMEEYVKNTEKKCYIVGTEDGLSYRLRKDNPDKNFYFVGEVCYGMKRNTLHEIFLQFNSSIFFLCLENLFL
jgi:quinolinate synthase